jgi:hypothetical protein
MVGDAIPIVVGRVTDGRVTGGPHNAVFVVWGF